MKKIIFILLASFTLAGCNRIDSHQPLSSHKLSYLKSYSIGQKFVSNRDGLNMVNICIRNPSRVLLPLQFTLLDDAGIELRQLNLDAGNIDNVDCTRIQFEPISDSKGKVYTSIITVMKDSEPDSKYVELTKPSIFIEAHGGGDYLGGNAVVDGQESIYDLHFKTYYKQDLRSVIEESFSNFGVRLTQDLFFDIIFILLIIWVFKKYRDAK